MPRRSLRRWGARAVWALWAVPAAEAAPPEGGAAAREPAEGAQHLGITLGLSHSAFKDAHVSPRIQRGGGLRYGLELDGLGGAAIDRLSVHYAEASAGLWSWRSMGLRWAYSPEIVSLGSWRLHLGADWESLWTQRTFRDTPTWQGHSTVGPTLTARRALPLGGHRLWITAGISSPLVGIMARPGYAFTYQRDQLSGEDLFFAAPHRLRAVTADASVVWRRPGGEALRFALSAWARQITERQEAVEQGGFVTVSGYWRLW